MIDRVRAGVLEQGTVDLLHAAGVGSRLQQEGLRHEGLHQLPVRHHIDFAELTGGKAITVYGQNEVVRDLIDARTQRGRPLSSRPRTSRRRHRFVDAHRALPARGRGSRGSVAISSPAAMVHGICRPSIPDGVLTIYERVYPFGWLGILAEAAPSSDELVYTYHERGFALFSMRSPKITRLYLQVPPDEPIRNWSDEAIWAEMLERMTTRDGWRPNVGRIMQKSVTPMRSFVATPMRHGRLFLAGDAAHRPADRGEGLEPGSLRCARSRTGNKGVLCMRAHGMAGHILRCVRPPRLEGAAVLVVDDVNAASLPARESVRPPASDRGPRLPDGSRAAMTSLAEQHVGLPAEIFESAVRCRRGGA